MVNIHQLQQIPLLRLDDGEFVVIGFARSRTIGFETLNPPKLAVFGVAMARGQIAPRHVWQQKVTEVKRWSRRVINATEKMLKLIVALVTPSVRKAPTGLRAIDPF